MSSPLRLLVAHALLLQVMPAAANDESAICTVLDPILNAVSNTNLGLSCSCSSTCTSNVGADGVCTFTSPSFSLASVYTVPSVTFSSTSHFLPCGSPASAGATFSVTMPSSMPTAVTDEIATLVADASQHMSYDSTSRIMTIEKSVEAGQTETFDVPFYKIGFALVSVQFVFRITVTVSGTAASFSVDQDLDLCVKLGTLATVCGANLPTCSTAGMSFLAKTTWRASLEGLFCTAIGDLNVKQLFGDPPFDIVDFSQQGFSNACSNTCTAPSSPAASDGGGGSAIVAVLVGLMCVGHTSAFQPTFPPLFVHAPCPSTLSLSPSPVCVSCAALSSASWVRSTTSR